MKEVRTKYVQVDETVEVQYCVIKRTSEYNGGGCFMSAGEWKLVEKCGDDYEKAVEVLKSVTSTWTDSVIETLTDEEINAMPKWEK